MSKAQETGGSGSEEANRDDRMLLEALRQQMERNNFVMTTLLGRIERLEAKDGEEVRDNGSKEKSQIGEVSGRRREGGIPRLGFDQHVGRNEGWRIENVRNEELYENEWGNEYDEEGYEFNLHNPRGRGFRPPRGRGFGGRRGGRNYRNWDYGIGEGVEERVDSYVGSIKMKIPSFHGKENPDLYLEWERQVELIFECHNYSEEKKVKLAAVEFKDYAIAWWDQLLVRRRNLGLRPIATWETMKENMRERFVPQHYFKELHQRLQRLSQGGRSVEEYFKAMEVALARTQLEEPMEATMARFLAGLHMEIAHVVELHSYNTLTEMVHIAIKVEKQMQMRKSLKYGNGPHASTTKSSWKPSVGKQERIEKEVAKQRKEEWKGKGKVEEKERKGGPTRAREVKCFKCLGHGHYANQCPNQRVMFIREDGGIESGDEEEEVETPNLAESDEEKELEMGEQDPMVGLSYAMVSMKALSAQVSLEDGDAIQRENIFYTRCAVNDKLCSMIIDSGSCCNVVSSHLVNKLGLVCKKHPKPYGLQWLNECNKLRVTKQVVVPFTIGKYKDEVLCDVVPMVATHILLGRPWQYDRNVTHDGRKNKYTLVKDGQTYNLNPLSPVNAHEDQVRIMRAIEGKSGEEENDTKKRGKREERKE